MKIDLPRFYRANVGLMLIGPGRRIFVGRRLNQPDAWQMPQGGVDRGESTLEAAYRELEEEIGVRSEHVDLLEETADWLYYEFPIDVRKKLSRGRYKGQRQKWFAFRFKGRDSDIRLDTHTPEFSDWRWAPLETAPELVIPFKRDIYQEIAQRFRKYSVGA